DDAGRDELLMGMHMDMPGHTRSSGASLQAIGAARGPGQLTMRLEVLNTLDHADMLMRPDNASPMYLLTWPDVRSRSVSLWSELVQVRGALRASLNGRLETARMEALNNQGVRQLQLSQPGAPSGRSDWPASLGLALDWEVQPTLNTGLSLGWSRRAPSTTEAFGYYLYVASDGYLYSGDPLLKQEQSVQLEWRTAWKSGPLDFRITLWHSEMLDWITGQPDPGEVPVPFARGWKRFANSGRARLQGLELHLRRALPGHWNLQGSGTLQHGWRVADGDPLAGMSPPSGRVSLSHERSRWSWLLELRGAAGRTHPSRLGQEEARAGFAVLQTRVELQAGSRLHLSLAVDNLLDRSYREASDWGSPLRPGRTLQFRLQYSGSNRF
ncbi:MAG: TonB-dependent receptor, partial [Candidatus Cloacimonetes bacterium]|nr:TonB-dependent receptor [Candidatus Cloacimonadota bacterium]